MDTRMIETSKIEQSEFNTAMFKHLEASPKGCEDMGDCIYCLTYGDIQLDRWQQS